MKKNKLVVTIVVVLACVALIFLVRSLRPNPEVVMKQRLAERSIGNSKATVWVTEYFDYQCPPCAMAGVVLHDLMKSFPDKIYLQVRYYPLPAHKNAMKAALYAECGARQKGKFWDYHLSILAHQNEWAEDVYPQIRFAQYAKEVGLDIPTLDVCVHDPEVEKFILDEKEKASELGVRITPSFFVNGKLVIGFADLKAELEKLLPELAELSLEATHADHEGHTNHVAQSVQTEAKK